MGLEAVIKGFASNHCSHLSRAQPKAKWHSGFLCWRVSTQVTPTGLPSKKRGILIVLAGSSFWVGLKRNMGVVPFSGPLLSSFQDYKKRGFQICSGGDLFSSWT